MKLPIFHIDAFTSKVFGGNPAAVCPLNSALDDATMQAIAGENNLSETAFFLKEGAHHRLRWFTPTCEVDLCGHATLASAFVYFNKLEPSQNSIQFETRSGILRVSRDGAFLPLTSQQYRHGSRPKYRKNLRRGSTRRLRPCGR